MLKLSLSREGLSVGAHQVHYAWVIVAVASAMWLVSSTIRVVFSGMVPYLADDAGDFGWSYGVIAFAVSLQWIVSGLCSPLASWVGNRYGIRRTMVFGALLFIVGMTLTGSMHHLWQFYLYFGFILGASIAIFQVPLVAAVTMWFKKHLGVAMGTLQASAGVGSVVSIFFVVLLLDHLTRIHRRTSLGTALEEASGCSSESGIMVLEQKPTRKQGAPNRCCHRTNPTVSASSLTTIAWWRMPACSYRPP